MIRIFTHIGGIIAFIVSYMTHHSIWWGILHWVLGWLYVTYWLLVYTNLEEILQPWFK